MLMNESCKITICTSVQQIVLHHNVTHVMREELNGKFQTLVALLSSSIRSCLPPVSNLGCLIVNSKGTFNQYTNMSLFLDCIFPLLRKIAPSRLELCGNVKGSWSRSDL